MPYDHRLTSASAAVLAFAAGAAGFGSDANASLTMDLRLTDGSKEVVPQVGQKLLVDIWAVVEGDSTDLTNSYGLGRFSGSIVSTGDVKLNVAGGKGDLDQYRKDPQQTTALRPFARSGEQPGTEQDLDGDGDIDLGSPPQNEQTGFIIMRSDPMEYYGLSDAVQPLPNGRGIQAKVGRVEITITDVAGTGELVWVPRQNADGRVATEAATWFDDEGGVSVKTGTDGTLLSSPLHFVPEPSATGLTALAAAGLLRRRRHAMIQ